MDSLSTQQRTRPVADSLSTQQRTRHVVDSLSTQQRTRPVVDSLSTQQRTRSVLDSLSTQQRTRHVVDSLTLSHNKRLNLLGAVAQKKRRRSPNLNDPSNRTLDRTPPRGRGVSGGGGSLFSSRFFVVVYNTLIVTTVSFLSFSVFWSFVVIFKTTLLVLGFKASGFFFGAFGSFR